MEALLNTEWLDMLCRALVEHCIESVALVSHHYWNDPDSGVWQVEMFPALMLDSTGDVRYDLNVSFDIHEVAKVVEKVTFLQCSSDKITMCASFAGHTFNFEFMFEPPEDAEIAGSMDEQGNVVSAQEAPPPANRPD